MDNDENEDEISFGFGDASGGLEQVLSKFKKMLERRLGKGRGKLVKTIPMKVEWVKEHKALMDMADKLVAMEAEMKSRRNVLWGNIQKDMADYTAPKHINDMTLEIEVYAELDENGR